MDTTWLTILAATALGMLLGCTSANVKAFIVGATLGMLVYCVLTPAANPDAPLASGLAMHLAIFLTALMCTHGIRKLIRSVTRHDEQGDDIQRTE